MSELTLQINAIETEVCGYMCSLQSDCVSFSNSNESQGTRCFLYNQYPTTANNISGVFMKGNMNSAYSVLWLVSLPPNPPVVGLNSDWKPKLYGQCLT